MKELSIIIPLDFSRRPTDLMRRAIHLLDFFEHDQSELIFSISNRGGVIEKKLCQKLLKRQNTILVYDQNTNQPLPPLARLRNIGAAHATRSFLLFLDVDLLISHDALVRTYQKITTKNLPYIAIPVIYLSRRGSKRAMSATRQALSWYLGLRNDLVDGIAINSSLIMISREKFHHLNGFHDDYIGHGYEDFDFLLRALDIPASENILSENLFIDRTSASPAQAWGFRAYLAQYSLPTFLDHIFAVHLHHDRCRGDGYYEHRLHNFRHFKSRLHHYTQTQSTNHHLHDFTPLWTKQLFIQILEQQQKNIADYRALFEWQGVQRTSPLLRVKRRIFHYIGMWINSLNLYLGRRYAD